MITRDRGKKAELSHSHNRPSRISHLPVRLAANISGSFGDQHHTHLSFALEIIDPHDTVAPLQLRNHQSDVWSHCAIYESEATPNP
jgi:hypothetical protein